MRKFKINHRRSAKNIFCCLCGIFLLALSVDLKAQNNPVRKQQTGTSIHLQVYYQSASVGDVNTAISALHYLIASDSERYSNWQDTLALLYVRNNAFQQAHLLADALLSTKGYSALRMEIKAVCAKALQQPAEAIDAYAILYNKTNSPAYGFEELRLQYAIRRLAEAVVTGSDLLQKISTTNKDFVNVLKTDGKTSQQVSLKAAICNILGLAYMDLNDHAGAIVQFDAALKENPDFELAKKNLLSTQAIVDISKK